MLPEDSPILLAWSIHADELMRKEVTRAELIDLIELMSNRQAASRVKGANPFRGRWRIVSTDVWDKKDLDDLGPAQSSLRSAFGPVSPFVHTQIGVYHTHDGKEANQT